MKEKTNVQSLFVAILLIVAGTLSPSNGVDDRVNKTPVYLIITLLIIITISFLIYFLEFTREVRKNK